MTPRFPSTTQTFWETVRRNNTCAGFRTSRHVDAPLGLPPHGRLAFSIEQSAEERFQQRFDALEAEDYKMVERYFGEGQKESERTLASDRMSSFLLNLSENSELRQCLDLEIVNRDEWLTEESSNAAEGEVSKFIEIEKRTRLAYGVHRDSFPHRSGTVVATRASQTSSRTRCTTVS